MQTGRPVRPVQCVPDAAGPRHRPDAVLHRAQEGASRLRPSYALSLDVGQSFLLSPRDRMESKASSCVLSLDEEVWPCTSDWGALFVGTVTPT